MDGESSISETSVGLSLEPIDADDDEQTRLERLNEVFLDISEAADSGAINTHSMRYVQHGDGLRLCLNEIIELRGPSEEDLHLDELRYDYIQTLFGKSGLLTPHQRALLDEHSDQLQKEYTQAVVAKIAKLIEARTPREALELGQLPPIIRKASFNEGQEVSMEQFTANHLYLLVDTLLKEHLKRWDIIAGERKNSSIRSRIASSSGTRLAIGGAIGLASLAPELSFVPRPEEVITHDLELALRGLSGVIISINVPEYVRIKELARKNKKRTRWHIDKLSDNRQICDRTMRICYGSARYGGASQDTLVSGRFGTDDKKENMRRLSAMEGNFPHLNNDPGGKPYTARQAQSYAARLLIDREAQLETIIDPSKSANEQEQLFLQLCSELITEDVRRMKKGMNVTKYRQAALAALGIVPAILFPAATTAASDAASLGKDTVGVIEYEPPYNSED